MVKVLSISERGYTRSILVKAFSFDDFAEYIQQLRDYDKISVVASRACTPEDRVQIQQVCSNNLATMRYAGIVRHEYATIEVDSLEMFNQYVQNRDPDEITTVFVSMSNTRLTEARNIIDVVNADHATFVWGGYYRED